MIESLEPRKLLAAAFEVDGRILRIFGTPRRDHVALGLSPDGSLFDINVFDSAGALLQQQTFRTAEINLISASLGDSADQLILGLVPIPAFIRGGMGPDTISGGPGNDTIFGDGGFDVIVGREGTDELTGGLQGDVIFGSAGNDTIRGVSGPDDNDDTIAGGGGIDTLDYSALSSRVLINVGDFTTPDADVSDRVHGDVEILIGTDFNDRLFNLTRRGMRIDGRAGNDTIHGGSGNDTLIGGAGSDTLRGFGGNDSFDASNGAADVVDGGSGNDSATADAGLDEISGIETEV
ncbi:MAG: hypothetical protein RMJ35_01465 [Phycisphaerales bacterium]|nr:hypothetical protein [Phycisphaerales bacterium]